MTVAKEKRAFATVSGSSFAANIGLWNQSAVSFNWTSSLGGPASPRYTRLYDNIVDPGLANATASDGRTLRCVYP